MRTNRETAGPALSPGSRRLGSWRVGPMGPALLGAAFCSSSAVLVHLSGAAPGTTAFYRCALALPGLAVLALLEQRRRGRRPVADRARAGAAGVFLGADLVLWAHAIYDVGAGVATVLSNLQVLFVAVIAWAVYRERPRLRFLVALAVVVAGVVLVAGLTAKGQPGYHPLAGVWYGLATSFVYALFILALRRSTQPSPSGEAHHVAGPLADATLGAALSALVLGGALGQLNFRPPLGSLGWLVVLALSSQTIGWLLITSSLPYLPAAVSSLLLLFQPASTLVLAAIVLAERPTALQLLGALLVCGGVLFASRSGPALTNLAADPVAT